MNTIKNNRINTLLRHGAIWVMVFALLAVIGLNPVDIGAFLGAHIGRAVGVSVGVPENPFNKLALELREKESELEAREAAIAAQENAGGSIGEGQMVLILSIGVLALFVLLLVNYYLDYQRSLNRGRES